MSDLRPHAQCARGRRVDHPETRENAQNVLLASGIAQKPLAQRSGCSLRWFGPSPILTPGSGK